MRADMVALDRDDRPVILVEVKARRAKREDCDQLLAYLRAEPDVPFGMLVDIESISLFDRSSLKSGAPILEFEAGGIFREYDPDFAGKDSVVGSVRIFHDYLTSLTEGWLRDFAFHWKSASPPASESLEALGLPRRLEGGTAIDEVAIGDALS